MVERSTYTGGCHCGTVRFRITTKLERAIGCNCSICSKSGSLLAVVPGEDFELLGGRESLRDYQFGKKRVHHLFCERCGIKSFARATAPDGREMVAVNVRCLDGVDLAAIPVTPFDGKSLPID